MATLSTATNNFAALVQETVEKAAEQELRGRLVHTIPSNYRALRMIPGTNLVRLARYADQAAQTVALTEGSPPTSQSLTIASESFSATQVGGVYEVTDLGVLDSPLDIISINAERAGFQAAKTIDELVRLVLVAGASVQYVTATSRATLATSNVVTGVQIKKMVRALVNNNVPTFGDGFYRAFIHPYVAYDLFTDTATGGWMDISKYTNNLPLLAGEIGAYHKVRFLESSAASRIVDGGASSADVFSTYFCGPESYGLADSQPLSSYFIAPGSMSDPLAQLAKIGWKTRFGCALIDEAGPRYIRLESGATDAT